MALKDLTEQQRAFIDKYLKKGLFSGKQNKRTTDAYERYLPVEREFLAAMKRLPGSEDQVKALGGRAAPAMARKNSGDFDGALGDLRLLIAEAQQLEQTYLAAHNAAVVQFRQALGLLPGNEPRVAELASRADPHLRITEATAVPAAIAALGQLTADCGQLGATLAREHELARMARKLEDLAKKNPRASAAARDALDEFAKLTEGVRPTPEVLKVAAAAVSDARSTADAAAEGVRQADAMPAGTPEEIRLREDAIRSASSELAKAKESLKTAEDRERAFLGTSLLTLALSHGPLSGEAGRPFPDAVAEKFVAGYKADPRLAEAAVGAATGARHPDAVADNLAAMIGRVQTGFADETGKTLPEGTEPRDYAAKMLAMGAHCGAAYFERFDDYIKTGGHLAEAPFQEAEGDKASVRSQKRTVALAGGLIGDDGAVNPGSDKARAAIGNVLYHPEAVANPQPALNDQILRTLTLFSDPTDGPKANALLKGVGKPAPGGGAETLVGRALGKSGEVTAEDARQAALAAMLKPLDQGPVGSCFSTAPCRRMRETKPLDALKNYTDIAGKGTLSTARRADLPVVTNIPPGEDPIMRTMEYTLATAMAVDAKSIQKKRIKNMSTDGVLAMEEDIKTALGKAPTDDVGGEMYDVREAVRHAFDIEYNPTVSIGGVSGDGSSTEGRYVIKRKSDGKEITSEAEYRDTIEPLILGALNLDPNSSEAKALVPSIQSKFIAELNKDTRTPWKMASGGETAEATGELFGEMDEVETMARNGSKSDTREKQGARTLQVMEGLLNGFGANPPDMITMKTQSIHGFNALPNNPTLKPLLEGSGTMADKLKAALVDPGKKLAETKLSADRAAWHFDKAVTDHRKTILGWIKNAKDDTARERNERRLEDYDRKAKEQRPTEELTPAEITERMVEVRKGIFGKPENCKDGMAADLLSDLGGPQIVIADSNWGTGENHTYFVVAPDPLSGQPVLWKKKEPPGTMTILDPKWIDDKWAILKPKTTP